MSRILIDGRFIGVGESMTRYILPILRRILAWDKENEYTLLIRPQGLDVVSWSFNIQYPISNIQLSDHQDTGNWKLEIRNLHLKVLDIPHYSLAEQTKLLSYLNCEKFDLVHFIQFNHPIGYRGKFVTTVHDLTLLGYIGYFNPVKRLALEKVMKSAVLDATKVITVSEQSKKEILEQYAVKPEKVRAIYNGIEHQIFSSDVRRQTSDVEVFKEKYGIIGDYILYTGAWKKHKNLKRLLQAFEKFLISHHTTPNPSYLRRGMDAADSSPKVGEVGWGMKRIQLVLVGKQDEKEPEIIAEIDRINNSSDVSRQTSIVVTTGFIDDSELPIAYAGAKAYIIPSLAEGFGLPPLEAMACGTPVAASNNSCIPEVLGEAALYFDPENIDDMAKAIERITTDEALRSDLTEKGYHQAAKYTWDKAARETFEVYKQVLNG